MSRFCVLMSSSCVQGKVEKTNETAKEEVTSSKNEVSKGKKSQKGEKGKGEDDKDEDSRSDDDEKDGRERSSSCSKESGEEGETGGQIYPVRLGDEEDEDVDEDDWRPTTKQKKLDQQDKKSHPVHAPFFPEVVNFAVLHSCGMDECLGACVQYA